jgi:hypothetical protein
MQNNQGDQGPMLWFFKYFRRIFRRKKLAFLTQNKASLCKMLIITLVFEKNANFFAENCQKSQKIVIITLVPGWPGGQIIYFWELLGNYRSSLYFGATYIVHSWGYALNLTKKWVWATFWVNRTEDRGFESRQGVRCSGFYTLQCCSVKLNSHSHVCAFEWNQNFPYLHSSKILVRILCAKWCHRMDGSIPPNSSLGSQDPGSTQTTQKMRSSW